MKQPGKKDKAAKPPHQTAFQAQQERRAKGAPNRMEDVDAEFKAAVAAKEEGLGRASSLDERVEIMQDLMQRELTPSEVVKLAKRIRIMIHKTEKVDAVDPVPISVNGYTITVKRGEVVEIPEHFLEALENAVESHFTFKQDKSDPSVLLVDQHDAPSYPYSVNPRAPQRGERTH
jgi:hypothetical protein